jgi:hypothetical protein
MSRSPGFPTAGGLPVTPDVQNTATSSKRRNRSTAKRRCSLPSATTASRNGVAIMRCPIAARSAEPRLAAAGRESEVQNRRCLENLGRVLRPLQRSAKKAARPRRLRQATQPRPIEQVERHGDPRKVTGSSQRSLLHAAGVPSVPGFRKICVQPATRTFTDIGAPSSIVRAARSSSPLSRFTG